MKLKEISYIYTESFAAGELKHGTIALIEEGTPVFVVATQERLYEKIISNVKEVKARGAHVVEITHLDNKMCIRDRTNLKRKFNFITNRDDGVSRVMFFNSLMLKVNKI